MYTPLCIKHLDKTVDHMNHINRASLEFESMCEDSVSIPKTTIAPRNYAIYPQKARLGAPFPKILLWRPWLLVSGLSTVRFSIHWSLKRFCNGLMSTEKIFIPIAPNDQKIAFGKHTVDGVQNFGQSSGLCIHI